MLYTKTEYPLNQLIGDIDLGKIGLPELQRPFVWTNAKVRNLFDSLYRGYPVGFFLFWETGAVAGLRGIGENKAVVPQLAIVDGQQRLTSLYAVIKGKAVKRAAFPTRRSASRSVRSPSGSMWRAPRPRTIAVTSTTSPFYGPMMPISSASLVTILPIWNRYGH